jgi:hypothetical protein
MEPINFIYWLQGFLELEDPKELSTAQVAMIKKHIALVLTPVTSEGVEALLRRSQARDPNPKIC